MSISQLFLAHHNHSAGEVTELATSLRLHGILPWIDKDGGFAVADQCEAEARRAIREDCFGLALYATAEAFDSQFIKNVEIDEAVKVRRQNPGFDLFAIPREIGFDKLRSLSENKFGIDLAAIHAVAIPSVASLPTAHNQIASDVLDRILRRARNDDGSKCLSMQFSTREILPEQPADVLCIDAVGLFSNGCPSADNWERWLDALQRVKRQIAKIYGRPRLNVHGSKHLSAAFVFGRVFERFKMDIRQTEHAVWSTDIETLLQPSLHITIEPGGEESKHLFLEIAFRNKNISRAVESSFKLSDLSPVRLQVRPEYEPLTLDYSSCVASVTQIYSQIELVMQRYEITDIHIFAAVPRRS